MAASAEFFRRQAERCAEIARRTHDEDSRERCEQLRQTYCRLAETEEQQTPHLGENTKKKREENVNVCSVSK